MLVQEIMSKNIVTITSSKSVFEAASQLRENKVGCVLAVDPDGTVGIVTKRDIIGGTILQHKNAETTPVSEIMNTDIITIHPLKNLEEAVETMEKNKIKKLIVEKEGAIMGIITVTDISKATKDINKRSMDSCLNMGKE
jgi:CBS domain-containing protein